MTPIGRLQARFRVETWPVLQLRIMNHGAEETMTAPDDLQSRVAGLRRTIEAQEEVTMSLKAQF